MTTARRILILALVAGLTLPALPTFAQPMATSGTTGTTGTKPTTNIRGQKTQKGLPGATGATGTTGRSGAPGSTGAAATPSLPTKDLPSLLFKRERTREWTLRADLNINQLASVVGDTVVRDRPATMRIKSAVIIFPVPLRTANSDFVQGGDFSGELRADGNILSAQAAFIEGYPAGARFAKWTIQDVQANGLRLALQIPYSCSRLTIDENLAKLFAWPASLPPVAASAMKPQLGVEFTEQMGYVRAKDPKFPAYDIQISDTAKACKTLIEKWTSKQDPKKLPPYQLAKFLAGMVAQEFQSTGNGYNSNRDSSFQGFELKGALTTISEGRGSPHDLVCLLTALYRSVGIPARTVIGLDATGDRDNAKLAGRTGSREKLISWVEFALIDPNTSQEIWVPVDLTKMRGTSSRLRDLNIPWNYFGTHNDLDAYIPIGFQFHPPTTVSAFGSPALWGWNVDPKVASMEQSINFYAYSTPIKANPPNPATTPPPPPAPGR